MQCSQDRSVYALKLLCLKYSIGIMEVEIVKQWICIFIIVSGNVQSANTSLFQCRSSGQEIYTPDIPDSYFNLTSLRAYIENNTVRATPKRASYVFTIPAPHDCGGTVKSVQFCYQQGMMGRRMRGDQGSRVIFTLSQVSNTGEMTNCIDIERNNSMCSTDDSRPRVCCQISQLQISTSNHTFGVMSRSELQLLAFSDSVMRYRVEHYQTSDLALPLMNGSLILLRFFIRM